MTRALMTRDATPAIIIPSIQLMTAKSVSISAKRRSSTDLALGDDPAPHRHPGAGRDPSVNGTSGRALGPGLRQDDDAANQ